MTTADIRKSFISTLPTDCVVCGESDRLFKPDILVIDSQGLVNEYEIKISQSDLMKEVNYIKQVFLAKPYLISIGPLFEEKYDYTNPKFIERREKMKELGINYYDNKFRKHWQYLVGTDYGYNSSDYKPNRFYFLISKELYEKNKEFLDTLPYGVIDSYDHYSLKKCKRIHSEEANYSVVLAAATALSNNLRFRKEQ